MKKYLVPFYIGILLIVAPFVIVSQGASSGDEGAPPPISGGSGGGGGSPEFFDYFVPLVFNSSHPHGLSEVVVWIIQPSVLITSFAMDASGVNQMQVFEPQKFTFNPSISPGLTNGSLIRTTSPVLIVGQRLTSDIFTDQSFAYSMLSSRMMGFEYIAPFDGWISLITNTANTVVNVANPSELSIPWRIPLGESTISIPVKEGSYINSTYPTNAAFISYSDGVSATMAVPDYLRGSSYIFDGNSTAEKEVEIDQSYISINPEEPTELEFTYLDGSQTKMVIFKTTKIYFDPTLRGINSSRGKIEVNFRFRYTYSGLTRSSSLQLIAAPEMRAGEVFTNPNGYSSHLVVINNNTQYMTGNYDQLSYTYALSSRHTINKSSYETFSFNSLEDLHVIFGNKSAFGYLLGPGKVGHPMSPSVAFLNIPINTQTSQNITGILSTWYRFPNLAVGLIDVFPNPQEEYTGQTIRIEVISNGSLPAGRFQLEIIIDDESVVDQTYDFLQVNDSLVFEYREFIGYGAKTMDISVNVDVNNEVNEINEEDNKLSHEVEIKENIRIRWSFYGIVLVISVYALIRFRRLVITKRETTRAHVDAILSFEEGEG
ncbi:MAG: CARDB domain-containing protein [Candidatus Kariarchaeaceae archaeon]|jgi:hypothetical protein